MADRRGREIVNLRTFFPDRRVSWAGQAIVGVAGSLAFLTAGVDAPGPFWFAAGAVIFAYVIWIFLRLGRIPNLAQHRFEPSFWRFSFTPPAGPERTPSAWMLWGAACLASAAYFLSFIRLFFVLA